MGKLDVFKITQAHGYIFQILTAEALCIGHLPKRKKLSFACTGRRNYISFACCYFAQYYNLLCVGAFFCYGVFF